MENPRAALRRRYIAARQELAPEARSDAERRIIGHIQKLPVLVAARTIAAFVGTRGEVNVQRYLDEPGKQFALPIVGQSRGEMTLHAYQGAASLKTNRYEIPEPSATAPEIPLSAIDVMLMPLVAFDRSGNRLGMGGGYYDRFLAHEETTTGSRPYLLGVAFACQEADVIAAESWDVRLNAVVTENGVLEFG